jgi:hypothetical protein
MNSIRPTQAYIDESYSSKSVAPIEDSHTRLNTAMLLENQEAWCLNEDNTAGNGGSFGNGASIGVGGNASGTPGTDSYAPNDARLPKILIPMIRRTFPELITNEIVGVQPMAGPVGLAFALRYKYSGETLGTGIDGKNFAAGGNTPTHQPGGGLGSEAEAGYQELRTSYTGTSAGYLSGVGTNPLSADVTKIIGDNDKGVAALLKNFE